jgi:hypothetical protein
MSSKQKLKRKLRKQKTRHWLEMSDLYIKLDNVNYDIVFARVHIKNLVRENQKLNHEVMSLKRSQEPKDVIDYNSLIEEAEEIPND